MNILAQLTIKLEDGIEEEIANEHCNVNRNMLQGLGSGGGRLNQPALISQTLIQYKQSKKKCRT